MEKIQAIDRTTFIGGSDSAGVLGLSRWDTPLSIWAQKTGQYIKPEVESEAAELGRELEDYVAKRFERKTGKRVSRASETSFHPSYSYLGANVDRLIDGEDAGLECKTASAWKSKEWEGEEIPQEYIVQCYHYMMVTGRKKWYLAVLIGNQDFQIREINWDEKFIASMLEREVEFWTKFVVPKVMPAGMVTKYDADTLLGLYPTAMEGTRIKLSDEANILVENLEAYKKDSKNIDDLIDLAENQLKAMLGTMEMGETSLYQIGWKNSHRSTLDQKGLKELHPVIHAAFYLTKPTRLFRYKPLKGDQNG